MTDGTASHSRNMWRKIGAVLKDHVWIGARLSYSQEGEDLLLERLMGSGKKRDGFFVDIGAHHPMRFSNTYRFYRRGWRGINVDARPGFKRVFDWRRSRDINIQCGVAATAGSLEFIEFNEPALNTFSADIAAQRCSPSCYVIRRISIPVLPLAELLAQHLPQGQEIDFMSVDVEGFDYDVMASNDWKRFRPRFVVVEMLNVAFEDVALQPIGRLLADAGYRPAAKTYNSVVFGL